MVPEGSRQIWSFGPWLDPTAALERHQALPVWLVFEMGRRRGEIRGRRRGEIREGVRLEYLNARHRLEKCQTGRYGHSLAAAFPTPLL